MTELYKNDIKELSNKLSFLPRNWDGKEAILELKNADYNWRQMEWIGFYLEYKVRQLLKNTRFHIPGDTFGAVTFDAKGFINWDVKAKAIKCDSRSVILNDRIAMEQSIEQKRFHGEIIGLLDVHYNDNNRSFQQWHSELKGGLSKYEQDRIQRTSVSRYRKTDAQLAQILLVVFDKNDLENLPIMKQGRNSNGNLRKEKYMLNLDNIDQYEYYTVEYL